MKIKQIFLLVTALASATIAAAQTRVIAHRGYWQTAGSAQNSITALQRACDIGVYGSEFDVHLTADKVVVVNHDDSIQGHAIAASNYDDLKLLRLSNGETMPTLREYLRAGKQCPGLQLILEIKPQRGKAEEDTLTARCVAMVREMGMASRVEYISFSLNVCEQLVRISPASAIAYLGGDMAPSVLKAKGINGIDYNKKVLQNNPQWVEQAHDLGMTVNVWTVNDMEVVRQMKDLKVDFITTDIPVQAKQR